MLISFTCFSPFPLSFHISPFAGCFRIPLSKLARPLQCPVLCLWTTATILPNHLSIMARMILFCSVVVIMIMVCDAAMAPPRKVPAMLIFGDSILDSGNNNYVNTIVKCNFQPYGRDFVTRKPTGRFCNGKVPSDFAAEVLGVKEMLPPYLDPRLDLQQLLTGVCFASAGSGYDPRTFQFGNAIPITTQLDFLRRYIGRMNATVGEERTAYIVSQSAYITLIGSNDVSNMYPLVENFYDEDTYTDHMLNLALDFYQELYKLGARRIGLLTLPPTGCVPAIRVLNGGPTRGCYESLNRRVKLFNSKLSWAVDKLNNELPGAKFVLFDLYNPVLNLIQNPAPYGIEVVSRGCCGTGTVEVAILCIVPGSCTDANKYLFWDSYHPTEKASQILVHQVLAPHLNKLLR
ncbi:GDSL esterase/lipase EXL3 [Linum perenne]